MDFILSQIEKWNPADKAGYLRFIDTTKAIFQKGFVELADKPFLSIWDMIKIIPDLVRLQSHKTVYDYVKQFVSDDFLRRCFSFHPLLVGGNPFDTTSIYAMIHYLEREWGIHYALGGTGAIVQALGQLIEELEGQIHLNSPVAEIVVEGRKAKGVKLADGTLNRADHVISNADVAWTYMNLIPRQKRRRNSDNRYKRMHYSMSLFVIYFGTKRHYRDGKLAHHKIILGERYKGLLADIFKKKHLSADFSLYLHMPTLTDPRWLRKAANPSMSYPPSPIWAQMWTGERPRNLTVMPLCNSWKTTTCPAYRKTSSSSTPLTLCTSKTRSTATSALPSPSNRY
jgi:phytoene desaturase